MYTIYKITNEINNTIYIGVTSTSLEKRLQLHISASKKDQKRNLYKAFSELGYENFKIFPLIKVETKKEASKLETEYIKKYIEAGIKLYNMQYNSSLSKTFYSYDLKTKEIKKYTSFACFEKNIPAKVSVILNNSIDSKGYKRITCDKKLWSYINEKENWEKLLKLNSEKGEMPNKRKVLNVTTGEIFNSCRDAAKSCGLKNSVSISEACSGRKKTAAKFVWKYI